MRRLVFRQFDGSQFLANEVKAYLKSVEAKQEFTHIATPEENSYIEAFHSIINREMVQRYEFDSFYEAKLSMERYMQFYNHQRRHGYLGRITPQHKWEQGVAARAAVKLQDFALAGLSRSVDSTEKLNELLTVHFNFEKPKALEYLCLTGDLASEDNDTTEIENLSDF